MKLRCLSPLVLSLCALAQTPAPANLTGMAITNQVNLGAALAWNAVGSDTYSIYRSGGNYGCKGKPEWTEIAEGITAASYDDIPSSSPLALGFWCYAVTATDPKTGIESAMSNLVPVAVGDKSYFVLAYRDAMCEKPVKPFPPGGKLTVTQIRNGVSTVILHQTSPHGGFGGFIRLYDDAQYSAQFTLPDGKVLKFPEPLFPPGQPVSAIVSNLNEATLAVGDDRFCSYVAQSTLQPATSNP